MAGIIIGCIVYFGCGFLFYFIGVYAKNRKKPMHFYSGTEIKESEITDIAQYNLENARMWKLYSLWYFAAGIVQFYRSIFAVVILILSCVPGIFLLIHQYNRIYKKYKK